VSILPITNRLRRTDANLIPDMLTVSDKTKENTTIRMRLHTIDKRRSAAEHEQTVFESEFSALADNRFVARTESAADRRVHQPPFAVVSEAPVVHRREFDSEIFK